MSIEGYFEREMDGLDDALETGAITQEEYGKHVTDLERERVELEREEYQRNEDQERENR